MAGLFCFVKWWDKMEGIPSNKDNELKYMHLKRLEKKVFMNY